MAVASDRPAGGGVRAYFGLSEPLPVPTLEAARAAAAAAADASLVDAEARPRGSRGAERSLVAFDVDRTILHQGAPDELERFRGGICRSLIRLARLGIHLAAITGNSLAQLSARLLKALVEELCEQRALGLISCFHFFCNGAAVYVHFRAVRCEKFAELLTRAEGLSAEELHLEAARCMFDEDCGGVRPSFVFQRYVQQCCIPQEDADDIIAICQEESRAWWASVCDDGGRISAELQQRFYVKTGDAEADAALEREARDDAVNTEASVHDGFGPEASARKCMASDGTEYITACNVLPVLSFRHVRGELLPPAQDPRMRVLERIKRRMRSVGLVRYVVSPGGRSTIDVSHHLVSKRSAVMWLLRQLGVEGVQQLGEPMGVNAVYFGDEVVLHGNDMPVAEVPGILVFAVNELRQRVPFRTNVELPTEFTRETGPEATEAVLSNLADFADAAAPGGGGAAREAGQSTVAAWKAQRLRGRVERKVCLLMQRSRERPAGPGSKVSYRRLEAAAAALTALTRRGEGLDEFADQVIDLVNSIGTVATQVRELQYEGVEAQGFCPPAQITANGHSTLEDSPVGERLRLERLLEQVKDEAAAASRKSWPRLGSSTLLG